MRTYTFVNTYIHIYKYTYTHEHTYSFMHPHAQIHVNHRHLAPFAHFYFLFSSAKSLFAFPKIIYDFFGKKKVLSFTRNIKHKTYVSRQFFYLIRVIENKHTHTFQGSWLDSCYWKFNSTRNIKQTHTFQGSWFDLIRVIENLIPYIFAVQPKQE